MDKDKLDSLRKGSMVYFIAPNESLKYYIGYVLKRVTIHRETKYSNGMIDKLRRTFLVITSSKNPGPSDRRYLIEYTVFNNSNVLEGLEVSDVPESLLKDLKEIKGVVLFNSNKVEFCIQWYRFLLRKLNLVEAYEANYRCLAPKLKGIVESMHYCLMIIQKSKMIEKK